MTMRDPTDVEALDSIMERIRMAESGDDYSASSTVRGSDGGTDSKVGAYGIMLSKWDALAAAAGIPGADWRDRAAQDAVARARVENDVRKVRKAQSDGEAKADVDPFVLAAVSFKFGADVSTWVSKRGGDISSIPELKSVGRYMENMSKQKPLRDETPMARMSPTMQRAVPKADPTLTKAQDRIRDALKSMVGYNEPIAGEEGATQDGSNENIQPV